MPYFQKEEIIEDIRKKYLNVQNKEYLNRFLRQYENMSDDVFEDILTKMNIQSMEDIYRVVENHLQGLSCTKVGSSDGRYKPRIKKDETLFSIIEDSKKIEEPSVVRLCYFIEHRLCEILSEDSAFSHTIGREERKKSLLKDLTLRYKGNCQVFSRLYVDMLAEVGVYSEIVRQQLDAEDLSHFDVVVFDGEKRFLVNVIGNVYRVQSNRLMRFGETKYEEYEQRIEDIYGPLTKFSKEEIKEMDESLGFVRKKDDRGDVVYFDEELNEYLENIQSRLSDKNISDSDGLDEIVLEYLKFVSSRECFIGNNDFMEKEAHYTSCMAKFIKTLNLQMNDRYTFDRQTFKINGDLRNLIEVWLLEDKKKEKLYYFEFDNNPIRECDGAIIYDRVANRELEIAKEDKRIPKDFRKIEEQASLDRMFGKYILTSEEVGRETGKEQRDTNFKKFVKDTMERISEKFNSR